MRVERALAENTVLAYARELGHPARCARDVWPNLRMYLYSGSPLALYEQKLRGLLGEGVTPYEVYSSTESPIAYQYRKDEPGLFVDLSAGYFEFEVPGSGERRPIHEVELGVVYDIVVTTHSGAFAYKLGDRVEKGRVPFVHRLRRKDGDSRVWGAILERVLRRPVVSVVVSTAILLALAAPALTLNTATTSVDDISIAEIEPVKHLQAAFPGGDEPAQVAIQANDVTSEPVRQAIAELERKALASGQMSNPIEVEISAER